MFVSLLNRQRKNKIQQNYSKINSLYTANFHGFAEKMLKKNKQDTAFKLTGFIDYILLKHMPSLMSFV